MNHRFLEIARALVRAAPLVLHDDRFALKGGTAINFFIRDLPRLSVDLDLVLADGRLGRDDALAAIGDGLAIARSKLETDGFDVRSKKGAAGPITTIFAREGNADIKIEVNHVMRGTVHPVRRASLVPRAQEILRADITLPLMAAEEVYGGKLVAALDRQHPRDLFDVMQLFDHGGITSGMRRCFVIYLACHNRPIHEVLYAPEKNIDDEYREQLVGMMSDDVDLDALVAARVRLLRELPASLDDAERGFLRSLARAEPDYVLLDVPHVAELPALQWKVENLRKLARNNPTKLRAQADALDERLGTLA